MLGGSFDQLHGFHHECTCSSNDVGMGSGGAQPRPLEYKCKCECINVRVLFVEELEGREWHRCVIVIIITPLLHHEMGEGDSEGRSQGLSSPDARLRPFTYKYEHKHCQRSCSHLYHSHGYLYSCLSLHRNPL